MTEHYVGHRERLRERFLKKGGAGTLPDYEVLELLLFGAKPRGDVKPLAKELLVVFGSLKNVLLATPEDLMKVKGMGEASVVALKVVQEASGRMLYAQAEEKPVMSSPQSVLDYCRTHMEGLKIEQFRLLFLDRKNQLIGDEVHQEGTIDMTPVFPREVIKRALDLGAGAIILVHNHPSGDPAPSDADIMLTQKIKQVAQELDIRIHDHIIVGSRDCTSFREQGLL